MINEVDEYELPEIRQLSFLQELILVCMYNYGALPEERYHKSNKVIMSAFENLYFKYPDIRAYIFAVAEMVHRPPYYVSGHGNWGLMRADKYGRAYFIDDPAQLEFHEMKLSEAGVEYLSINKKRMKRLSEIMRSWRL